VIEIIPTNTCPPDLAELASRSKAFAAYAPVVQLDIGDGNFVPARSWPYGEGQMDGEWGALTGTPQLQYEVHLMVKEPREVGRRLVRAGASRMLGHLEVFVGEQDAQDALAAWRAAGSREVGLALLLDTPLSALERLADGCDVVQLMSIGKLGYQGAPFEPAIYERIREVRAAHPHLVIEVDGGVSEKNIEELVRAGATRFGVGSAISKAQDPAAAYRHLKSLAENCELKTDILPS
jgi:ribulose-phosphate 3-epimerase